MKFYNFDEIARAGDCIQFVTSVLGLSVNREGRCQASWRGGNGYNVALKKDGWYDHKTKEGGSLLQLCALAKFSDDIQAAQNFLGDLLGLKTNVVRQSGPMVSARFDDLINQGFKEVKRYSYEDLDGELVHFVSRFEHAEKGKEFMQGTPAGWGLRNTIPILYRQKDWINSSYVVVVEGEKDADTLIDKLGVAATTNCGGADKWRPEYAESFKGKDVFICRDNDDAGAAHALRVSRELKSAAERIVVICPSTEPKGDVTDWVSSGGTAEQLYAMATDAPQVDVNALEPIDSMLEAAKLANKKPLCNYLTEEKQIGKETKLIEIPRKLGDFVKDIKARFLGFPNRVGTGNNTLFDHDRESGDIHYMRKPSDIVAWMMRKSDQLVKFKPGVGFVTREELFSALIADAYIYQSISNVPEWPKRADVYHKHGALPEPTKDHKYLHEFVDMFTPATPADRTLIKTFFCGVMWYKLGMPSPLWVTDSVDGRGSGKSKIIEIAAQLYLSTPIEMDQQDLKYKSDEITKRIVSASGREAKFLFMDNADGTVSSSKLASWVTSSHISGRAPYGTGEESRPNDLTIAVSSNSATLDDDLAVRAYMIFMKKPKHYDPNWLANVYAYMIKNRWNILAEIYDILNSGTSITGKCSTRFPEFERDVLRAVCEDRAEYDEAIQTILSRREASNVDKDIADLFEEIIKGRLEDIPGVDPENDNIFIKNQIFNKWVQWANESGDFESKITPQGVRNLAKNDHTKFLRSMPLKIWINGRTQQVRGYLWESDVENKHKRKLIMSGTGGAPFVTDLQDGDGGDSGDSD